MMASLDAMKIQMEYAEKINKAGSDEEKQTLKREMEEATQDTMLKLVWTTTVVGKFHDNYFVRCSFREFIRICSHLPVFSSYLLQISPRRSMKSAK